MEAIATDLCLRWLSEPAADPLHVAAEHSELPRTAAPFPDGQGDGWIELQDLHLGMHLCRVVHRFVPGQAGLAPMSDVRAALTEPILFIQTTRVGRGVLYDRRLERWLAHAADSCIFAHLDRVDHQHWAETGTTLEVTALGIGYSKLQRALGEATARDLLAALDIAALPSAQVHPVPGPLKAILESCLVDSLTGNLRRLHAQARVLDFLVALVGQRDALVRPEVRQRIPIIRLREELDQLYGSVPCLDELARRYGVSARALNECFKEAFGRTIFAYVTERRLEAAQACLRGGQAPLKVVAARLGYASVSHFSQAFIRKFGYRPGSIRHQSPPAGDG